MSALDSLLTRQEDLFGTPDISKAAKSSDISFLELPNNLQYIHFLEVGTILSHASHWPMLAIPGDAKKWPRMALF